LGGGQLLAATDEEVEKMTLLKVSPRTGMSHLLTSRDEFRAACREAYEKDLLANRVVLGSFASAKTDLMNGFFAYAKKVKKHA